MTVLLPDVGDLLRGKAQFNAGTVVELLAHLGARDVTWVSSGDPDHPLRDALPAAGVAVHDAAPDWAWADAEHAQLRAFLMQYPQGRERLRGADGAERDLAAALAAPLTPARVLGADVLGAAAAYHDRVRAALDEGPGTRWRARRLAELSAVLAAAAPGTVVLAALDDVPDLLAAVPGAALPDVTAFTPGETSRVRALADRAWALDEHDDLAALLAALDREPGDRVTPRAELDAAAAGVYLAVGDLDSARARLERAAHGLADGQPRSLAGLTLARLGQVRDALGERDLALRTYRAVLALSYAPRVAVEAAHAGVAEPFTVALE